MGSRIFIALNSVGKVASIPRKILFPQRSIFLTLVVVPIRQLKDSVFQYTIVSIQRKNEKDNLQAIELHIKHVFILVSMLQNFFVAITGKICQSLSIFRDDESICK
jgi:hypothetical protein